MRPDPLERILALGQTLSNHAAISHGERSVSYGQLRRRVLNVASGLRSRGQRLQVASGETPVGIAMAPSADLVTTLLAIQLAGYPCLPLPLNETPSSRRNAIIKDGAPWLIVADEQGGQCYEKAPEKAADEAVEVVALSDIGCPEESSLDALAGHSRSQGLAYLIYTSGSTGMPKGVEMGWGALSNLMDWQAGDPWLGRPARTALLTPVTFDVTFQEILGTLVVGGTLVVLEPRLRRDPVSLLRQVEAHRIERLFLPFVGLQALAEASRSHALVPSSLTDVVTAGEQLKVTPEIRQLFTSLEDARLHNHYGPTETHAATAETLDGDPMLWPDLPPIGRPIQGAEVLLLDPQPQNVHANVLDNALSTDSNAIAPGAEGELYVGGAGLARGYRNRPEETESRFLRDPRPGHSGMLYRTGDLGRQNADGAIEWVGRIDDQVKIRGHRVELGEVESALSRHEQVRQVVVVPRATGVTQELVAYVQADLPLEHSAAAVSETLTNWRNVWDQTYTQGGAASDPTFDLSGWISSSDGALLPEDHMREWVDNTVERILGLGPGRVLEVGCGSGLLLHRIAPRCAHYTGLDYSAPIIEQLAGSLARRDEIQGRVSLSCAPAHELDRALGGPVDLVVINSVLQHFPSPAYLIDVLEQAVSVTAPGGKVFIGDVTPFAFREAFFTWLEASGGELEGRELEERERAALREQVERRMAQDRELTLDPLFFDQVGARIPRVGRVEVQLHPGALRNELTDFRYDVILHLDEDARSDDVEAVDWSRLNIEERSVTGLLERVRAGCVVRGIPNARTRDAWAVADRLRDEETQLVTPFLDPHALYQAAEEQEISLEIRPELASRCFTAGAPGSCAPRPDERMEVEGQQELPGTGSRFASNPLRDRVARHLIPDLRNWAAEALPEASRPAAYVVIDSLPRTPSGKVDRRRLPAPSHHRPELATIYAAPRTDLEKTTEQIWRSVLGLERVGIDDSFFDLGGNSLGVVTLAAQLGRAIDEEVPVVAIFEHSTVRSLAAHLGAGSAADRSVPHGARGAQTRDAYRHRRNRRVSREQR